MRMHSFLADQKPVIFFMYIITLVTFIIIGKDDG